MELLTAYSCQFSGLALGNTTSLEPLHRRSLSKFMHESFRCALEDRKHTVWKVELDGNGYRCSPTKELLING